MSHRLLFIDDSGNREYARPGEHYGPGKSRHFVYGAVLLDQAEASKLTLRIQELKQIRFGTRLVEVKSNWLRIPHERHARYLTPYGITEAELARFVDEFYELVRLARIELIAAVVDKQHMQEDYPNPWYAPTVAYEVLLQRVVQAVPTGETVGVTIDDISGATPKLNQYKELLKRHHDQLRKIGSSLRRDLSFQSITGPVRFQHSQLSDLLQVADIAAYNVLRQFREYGNEWEDSPGENAILPMYEYFKRLSRKFRHDENGRVQGYGIVKFPLRKRVRWSIVKKNQQRAADLPPS